MERPKEREKQKEGWERENEGEGRMNEQMLVSN